MIKDEVMTFGQVLAKYRKKKGLLKDVAKLILKEDGQPISYQYLSELENDRRNPPSDHLIEEFARILDAPRELLYLKARRLPPDLRVQDDEKIAIEAIKALRSKLESRAAA